MDFSDKFYNDKLANNTFPIIIGDDFYTLEDFEKYANKNVIEVTEDNILSLFIFMNHFICRFNGQIYKDNLERVNCLFFNSNMNNGFNYFINNKNKITKQLLLSNFIASEKNELLSIIINFEKYCNAQKNIGYNFDKIFKELQGEENFSSISYNNIMYEYSNRVQELIHFYLKYNEILLSERYKNEK